MRECVEGLVRLPPEVSYDGFRSLLDYLLTDESPEGLSTEVGRALAAPCSSGHDAPGPAPYPASTPSTLTFGADRCCSI